RLTKNVKRLSSGRSVCASAMGVVDEHRLSTNGPVLSAGAAGAPASAPAPEAKFGVAVITSPTKTLSAAALRTHADSRDGDRSAAVPRRGARPWQPRRHRNPIR